MIDYTLMQMKPLAIKKSISFVKTMKRMEFLSLPTKQIEQVMDNLLMNSIKFTESVGDRYYRQDARQNDNA